MAGPIDPDMVGAARSLRRRALCNATLARIKREADRGSAAAQFQLGFTFLGHGVEAGCTARSPPDHKMAMHWLGKSAAGGEPRASVALGLMHYYGQGTPVCKVTASLCFFKAGRMGDGSGAAYFNTCQAEIMGAAWIANSLNDTAVTLRDGRHCPARPRLAFAYFKSASDMGHVHATFNVASMLYHGHGRPVDRPGAFANFLRAARGGIHDAMNCVAKMLATGDGCLVDQAQALRWFRAAADAGHYASQRALAQMLFDTDDPQGGQLWMKKAEAVADTLARLEQRAAKPSRRRRRPKPKPNRRGRQPVRLRTTKLSQWFSEML